MIKLLYIPLIVTSLFITNGCDYLKSDKTKVGEVYNYEDYYIHKNFSVSNHSKNIIFDLDDNVEYVKILSGLDADKFTVYGNKVHLNLEVDANNPQDINRDNVYEVKLYIVDENKDDSVILLQIKVDGNSHNDDNSSGGDDDNTTTNSDIDNDNIPNAVEEFLGMNPKDGDENKNGIADGLEGDNLFNKQWYIRALGTSTNPSGVESIVGNDLNLLNVYKEYMGYNSGNRIILQIVDSGIDIQHEDLKDNIDINRSLNGSVQGEPTPGGIFKPHGTMLAGIAAARAFNNKGVRGVAPFAKIAGSNWLVQQSLDGLEAAWYSGDGANEIAVTNNSWGTYYSVDTFYEDIMEQGAKELRDGKGRIYIFASGNARNANADANTQYVINNRYAIVVSAIEHDNKVASYSTAGANVWISAYGGSVSYDEGPTIATTYLSGKSTHTWDEDPNGNYTYAMAGSSAAAPMVTGAVALILEACPDLRWRDVKYILAKTAKKVDSDNPSWITNTKGFSFSRDYGFGLIDTKKAIDFCKNGYQNINIYRWATVTLDTNVSIGSSKTETLNLDKYEKIEWVEATIDIDSNGASDLDIYLTSPNGTKVLLVKHGTKIGDVFIPVQNWMKGGFRFSTGAFLDENSNGNWKVEIINNGNKSATLKKIELKIHGH